MHTNLLDHKGINVVSNTFGSVSFHLGWSTPRVAAVHIVFFASFAVKI
uniref:Uncharacterized protein n=1 Tax=Arundo donax TaxID=35708 RepID=A0A0A9CDG5_ARUDO